MDLDRELNKLTAPPPVASKVRSLSREEIEALQDAGEITPINQIPQFHMMKSIVPPMHKKVKSSYSISLGWKSLGAA